MAPGVILTMLLMTTSVLTVLSLILERREGLLERSLVAGIQSWEFAISHICTQVFVVIAQVALMLVVTFHVFNLVNNGSFIWVYALTVLQGIIGISYGLFLSGFCKNETSSFILTAGTLMPNILLSGKNFQIILCKNKIIT